MRRRQRRSLRNDDRGHGPQKMGDVVAQLMNRRGYGQQIIADEMAQLWEQVAGQRLASQTRAGEVVRGTLEVIAANSVVVQELTFRKKQLVKDWCDLAPTQKVKDIRFRVGAVK